MRNLLVIKTVVALTSVLPPTERSKKFLLWINKTF